MAPVPRLRYANCGEIDIAYQILAMDRSTCWCSQAPYTDRLCRQRAIDVPLPPSVGLFARVIRFDQRGIGLSSRVPSLDMIGPRFWAQDALAVMDAVGCERATIFAPGFTSLTGLVLAADFPERVNNLVIFNGAARTLRGPDYPIGSDESAAEAYTTVGMEPDAVEQGFDMLAIIARLSPPTPYSAPGGTTRVIGPPRPAWRGCSSPSSGSPTCARHCPVSARRR